MSGNGPGRDRPDAANRSIRLGLRANLGQFLLLVGVSALVGATVGQERAVLPLLADRVFGLRTLTTTIGFVVSKNGPSPVIALPFRNVIHRRPTSPRSS